MINEKVLNVLGYDKVLEEIAEYTVLSCSKRALLATLPCEDYFSVNEALDTTAEAVKLLYTYSVSGVDFFDEITDELDRAEKGATLSCAEVLRVMRLLRSSRLTNKAILSVNSDDIVIIKRIVSALYFDAYLENDISVKVISDDALADNASETLGQLRRKIKRLNEQIREKLSSYIRGEKVKYLQENIVTMRGDRYVIPVKAEYKGNIKGLIHDQSATGATVFIEPEAILELNNELKTAMLEEKAEIEKILSDLSHSIGIVAPRLRANIGLLSSVDVAFAKAEYAYKTHSVMPIMCDSGHLSIKKGRHPLIPRETVVPIDIYFGDKFSYLLITGPNTGGKTVSLKLVGLFTVMAMSGIFVPAAEGTRLSFFENVFADIGDEQSIEQSLSTFSSHMKNIIAITRQADEKSLVLIDEIGAGTDPDEGGALAQAVIEKLLETNSKGIITTHYSRLKEFAYTRGDIMNASMDFDGKTFAPLYRLAIGIPGSSNAIEISRILGLDGKVADRAVELLSDNKISFEKVLREAEKSRQEAENIRAEYSLLKSEAQAEADRVKAERAKLETDRNRFLQGAKAEARRIINEKTEEAEQLLDEIKEILKKAEVDGGDLIKARTIKNKIEDVKYGVAETEGPHFSDKPLDLASVKPGDGVYVASIGGAAVVTRVSAKKKEAEVLAGSLRLNVKEGEIYPLTDNTEKQKNKTSVSFTRNLASAAAAKTEINVIGQNVDEALLNVDKFIDECVVNNVAEIRIVHGKGMNILSRAIQAELKKNRNVSEFRFGVYGEGENGVTIVKLK